MRRLVQGKRTPALAVALLALVAAAATAASGAPERKSGTARMITGADIRDGSVEGIDIANGTVSGSDLRPGAVTLTHINDGTESALRGRRGPRGLRGPRGPEGERGRTGPRGEAALATLFYARTQVVAPPGGPASGKAACPAGTRPMGGGVHDPSGRVVVSSSFPVIAGGPGWTATVGNVDPVSPHEVTIHAVCARARAVRG